MRLRYSRHALDRMRERNISEREVEYCVNNPDIDKPGRDASRILAVTTPEGRKIQIVAEFTGNTTTIITAEEWGNEDY